VYGARAVTVKMLRFSLCCLLCACWYANALGQSPLTRRDSQVLRGYTRGVVCDPHRLEFLPMVLADSAAPRCELGAVALRILGAGRARKFGVGPGDTASVRCAFFFGGAFQVLTRPGGLPHRADRFWRVTLLTRKGPVAVHFDRWRAQIRVLPDNFAPLPKETRKACGLDER
jgi:hypothetical protein